MKAREVSRGDVWLCTLDPTMGHEIRKTRPCLIVSPDGMNGFLKTYTIMPLTSGGKFARFRPPVHFAGTSGRLLADQMRTVDQSRLQKFLGVIDPDTLSVALAVLREMFEE